jgi:putative ABC transport system permease protein
MFELEKAITNWRKRMEADPALEPGQIAELESHLRDKIDDLMARGRTPEEAFNEAVRALGETGVIGSQFFKVYTPRPSGRPSWQAPRFVPGLAWNYFRTAARVFRRNRGFTALNVLGLAVGMACCLFIAIFARHELSYDRYQADHDRVFRVILNSGRSGDPRYAITFRPLAPALQKEIPEIAKTARIGGFYYKQLLQKNETASYEDGCVYVDPEIFSLLTIPFIEGGPDTALRAPDTIVLPERLAKKYLPGQKALGQTIRVGVKDRLITGIVKDASKTTHMPYDIFLPISDMSYLEEDWTTPGVLTYIKLAPGADVRLVEQKVRYFGLEHYHPPAGAGGGTVSHSLQPLADAYLHSSDLEGDFCRRGQLSYLYIFAAIGLIVLGISCMNFTNLSIARSAVRAREAGIRKVVGAVKSDLIKQSLAEAGVMASLAMLTAVIIVASILPFLNSLLGVDLQWEALPWPSALIGLLLMTFVVTLLAGGYPALILGSLKPAHVLRGQYQSGATAIALRKTLVIVQFAVSLVLSIGTIVIYQQLQFMRQKNLGFQKEQRLVITVKGKPAIGLDWESLKNDFLRHAAITGAAGSTNFPGEGVKLMLRDTARLAGEADAQERTMYYYFFDSDFIAVYDMELAAGRRFDGGGSPEGDRTCLINEQAAAAFGWSLPREAVGHTVLVRGANPKEIIGVVKDFHFRGVQYPIEPLIIENGSSWFEHLTLNLKPESVGLAMAFIKETWKRRFPDNPLEYAFIDTIFSGLYQTEERAGRLVTVFAGLSLFIACLGLLALASYAAQQRTREIGIRKTLGASAVSIMGLLAGQYARWIAWAAVVAWPAAYFAAHRWLQTFAYRTSPRLWVFLLATGASCLIAGLTIAFKSFEAARTDPVCALKHE